MSRLLQFSTAVHFSRIAVLASAACMAIPHFVSAASPQAAAIESPTTESLSTSSLNGEVKQQISGAIASPAAAKQSSQSAVRQKTLEQISYDIEYLSSDAMAGRQPGTPGIKLAEEYIVAEYKKAGLKPLENGTYFQEMEVGNVKTVKRDQAELTFTGPNDTTLKLELGKDWQALISRRDFGLDSELVFVGYGISAEEHNYDEYANIDVKDKIVVLIRMEPQSADPNSVFDGADPSRHASGRAKTIAARRAGAAGIIMVNDGNTASDEERDELVQADRFGIQSLPFAQIKRRVFDDMLKLAPLHSPTGKPLDSLKKLEALIDKNMEPLSQVVTGWSADFKTEFNSKGVKTSNIVGIIEGEGPHADETIIIGAHYDHLGNGAYGSRAGGRREIHNGADDNATGTAAVIELARRFNQRDKKPGRRLVFICFTAEEMGLLGAMHYVDNPIFPLEKTAAMVNFDMIGWLRDDELTIYNWNTSPQLEPIFDAANEGLDLDLNKPVNGFGGSDHLPFNQRQIPNMFIHTGINAVYHTPEDDFEAINCEGALRVIDYSERVVDGLAELDQKPTYGTPKPFRLGVMLSDRDDVVTIDGVTSDSPAERAGLQEGDVILDVDGEAITSRRAITRVIRRDKGKTIKIKLKRDDAEVVLNVDLKNEGE